MTVKRGAGSYGLASGIAPAAFISVYKALWSDGGEAYGVDSDILAAVDQAVADGVDVLSLSIGSGAYTSYFNDLAYLNAAQVGWEWKWEWEWDSTPQHNASAPFAKTAPS